MWISLGALAGGIVGIGAWLATGYFVARYRHEGEAPSAPQESPATPEQPAKREGTAAVGLVVTALVFALLGGYFVWRDIGLQKVVAALVVSGVLAAIALVDWRVRRIPNLLVLVLLGWAVVQILWLERPLVRQAALGALLAGGVFFLIALIGRGTMGMGDVKLMAALGAILGYPGIIVALFVGIVAGGVAALILMLLRRVGRKDYIAYGPYLALGGWVALMIFLGFWL